MAIVSQDIVLFDETIRNNIVYGCPGEISDDRLRSAVEAAHVAEFTDRLPDGLDTWVGERGMRLSGGQRQRIAIARALFKNAPILIFDEATSSLDAVSERLVKDATEQLLRDRTTLVIAHRLSTIESVDQILVLDQGQIVEQGSHRELVEHNGIYTRLYRSQIQEIVQDQRGQTPVLNASFPFASDWPDDLNLNEAQRDVADAQRRLHFAVAAEPGSTAQRWRSGPAPTGPAGFSTHRFDVSVIVVGNISVGGTGKTPIVAAIANHLREHGWSPGIVSRGYGGKAKNWPQAVTPTSSPNLVGDEPVLLARRTHCPVVVAPDRPAAVRQLLAENNCDVVISDDGLQHLALHRDVEIAVVDSEFRLGNGFCLPAGPLREPASRLDELDYVICDGKNDPGYHYTLEGGYGCQSGRYRSTQTSGEIFPTPRSTPSPVLVGHRGFSSSCGAPDSRLSSTRFRIITALAQPIWHSPATMLFLLTEKDAVKCESVRNREHVVCSGGCDAGRGVLQRTD